MIRTEKLLPYLVFLLLFLLLPHTALGCSCLPPPTVQEEFERYENVLVAKLTGFEEVDKIVDGAEVYRSYAGILDVEKVYKGKLREKETIKIFSGGGGDCSGGFEASDIGISFLFYMNGPSTTSRHPAPLYGFGICSRSGNVRDVFSDLKYLDDWAALAGKTRLSGTVEAWGENLSLPSIDDLKIYVKGSRFRQQLKTDKDGFFEIWDIPPGNYSLTVQVPYGWKMFGSKVRLVKGYREWVETVGNTMRVSIAPKRHTEVRWYVKIDNAITGKVLSPTGRPMHGVCVSAFWLTPTSSSFRISENCTNERGEFSILELPPGKYRIQVNSRGNITASNPFETFYYPDVTEKEKAVPVEVKEGVSVSGIVIRVAKTMPLITISGQLTYKGGHPVADEEVRFEPEDDEKYEKVEVRTATDGRFSFQIPVGAKGELKAKTNIWVIQFENCAEALALRKTRTGRAADIQSNVVTIDSQDTQENIKIIYPLACR